ncbi:hypothetical protein niasHT_012581 [Heterodera trifolii]|uniref:Uncharacterized protein n=1 Tax=Heterodera trifolii TaxID=157864 RepID=A0ABD2L1J3_9BILA
MSRHVPRIVKGLKMRLKPPFRLITGTMHRLTGYCSVKRRQQNNNFISSRRSLKPLGAKVVFSAFFVRSSGKDRFFQHDCASIAAAVPCAVCAEDTDRRAFAGRSPLRYELWRTTSST